MYDTCITHVRDSYCKVLSFVFVNLCIKLAMVMCLCRPHPKLKHNKSSIIFIKTQLDCELLPDNALTKVYKGALVKKCYQTGKTQ